MSNSYLDFYNFNVLNEFFSNVTEQDLNKLRKLAQQQKEQRALTFKIRLLKQTLDKKIAESLSPITKKFR